MPQDGEVPQSEQKDQDKPRPKPATPKPTGRTFGRRGVEKQK